MAVSNAVDALKDHADIVLDQPDGRGVATFLRGPVLRGEQRVHPRRRQLDLGTTNSGERVTVPASQINLLITGASRSGKSYLTGLVAEELIDLGYSVVLVDPEGDHTNLAQIPGVIAVGGQEAPPDIDHLSQLIGVGRGSVVVDLSQMSPGAKHAYYQAAPARLASLRARNGLPHWMIFDEAHEPLHDQGPARTEYSPSRKGHCLITHRPAALCAKASDDIDVLIAMLADPTRQDLRDEPDPVPDSLARFTGLPRHDVVTRLGELHDATAVLVRRTSPHDLVAFTPRTRRTSHIRHWHSYTSSILDRHRQFFFHRAEHQPTGVVAANLTQFHRELAHCDPTIVGYHLHNGDFSRWISGVLRDEVLAEQFATIERAYHPKADPEPARATAHRPGEPVPPLTSTTIPDPAVFAVPNRPTTPCRAPRTRTPPQHHPAHPPPRPTRPRRSPCRTSSMPSLSDAHTEPGFANIQVPESYQGITLHKDEETMFEGQKSGTRIHASPCIWTMSPSPNSVRERPSSPSWPAPSTTTRCGRRIFEPVSHLRLPQPLRPAQRPDQAPRPAVPHPRFRPGRRRAAHRPGSLGGSPATRSWPTACRSNSRTQPVTTTR